MHGRGEAPALVAADALSSLSSALNTTEPVAPAMAAGALDSPPG